MTIEAFLKKVIQVIDADGVVCETSYGKCECSYDELAYGCGHRMPINRAHFFRHSKGKIKKILSIEDMLKPERSCEDDRKEIRYLLNLILGKLNKQEEE